MPIIDANAGVKLLMASPRASRRTTTRPVPRLNSAVTIGRPIATTDPKAMSRIAPTASPIASAPKLVDGGSTLKASILESFTSRPRPEYCSVANAIVPSREVAAARGS
jgi:hypothetical protein